MAKKDRKLEWKIGSAIIIVVLGLLVWGVVSLFWMGGTEKIEAVANQLKPGRDWILTQEHIETPKSFCGDVECPSVYRQWKTDHPLTKDELSSLLSRTGWNFEIKNSCSLDPYATGNYLTFCSAQGVSGEYRIIVSISGSNPPGESWVSLNVNEK